ncbi:MAG: DUF58 domain-containing protein [Actinomycetota bacterium]
MLTGRAFAVLAGGVLLWVVSRLVGSADLHVVAAGLLAIVALSAGFIRLRRHNLHATRRLSTRRAFPGTRVRVELDVQNRGRTGTSFLLLEDRLPASLGTPARVVLSDIPPLGRQSIGYAVSARSRGRYHIGPLSASVTDPFDLARTRIRFPGTHELIVYPEVEDLEVAHLATPAGGSGESASRQVFRTGEEFYTMRGYETGDDLRRIHWPSTARRGELMIRQDETARRATAVLLLDTRAGVAGATADAFERAVSAAASIGILYFRMGFTLRLATPELPPQVVSRDQLLETLALVRPSRTRVITPVLRQLRALASAAPSLVLVTHPPDPVEAATLIRSTSGYAARLAVLVHPREPEPSPLDQLDEEELRLEGARRSLAGAGWEVLPLKPHGRLRDVWRLRRKRPVRATAASS